MSDSTESGIVSRNEVEIFLAALDRNAGWDREQFVNAACEGNIQLLARVLKLLQNAGEDDSEYRLTPNTNTRAVIAESAIEAMANSEPNDEAIGNYILGASIGEGGTSIIYEATSLALPKKKLAIKLLKPGLESTDLFARFRLEAEALQTLNHPSIARIVDSGCTTHGRPYIVMERIEGPTITGHCQSNKLSLESVIALFLDICSAVQHAHQHGFIHRDLKPNNILVEEVDGRVVPRVLDFGLAKATNSGILGQTEIGQMLGTLEYMSPEQASLGSKPIDVRADVYSLTCILYEMIAGYSPLHFELQETDQVLDSLRIISQVTPRELGTVPQHRYTVSDRTLRGISPILVMGLKKDPNQRYESARDLAGDLLAFLESRPLQAKPLGFTERFSLCVKRNKVRFAVLSILTMSLLLSGIAGLVAFNQRLTAQREQEEIYQYLISSLDLFRPKGDGINAEPGDVLDAMVDHTDEIKNPKSEVELLLKLAAIADSRSETGTCIKAYEKIIELCKTQPNPSYCKLANFGIAKAYYDARQESDAFELLDKMNISRLETAVDIKIFKLRAECEISFGQLDESEADIRRIEESGIADANTLIQTDIIRGHILSRRGLYQQAIAQFKRVIDRLPKDSQQAANIAVDIGENICRMGDNQQGIEILIDAVELQEKVSSELSYALMRSRGVLLERLLAADRFVEALELATKMHSVFENMTDRDAVLKWNHLFAIRRAECFFGTGDYPKAIEVLLEPNTPFTEPWDIFERECLLACAYYRCQDVPNWRSHYDIAMQQEKVVSEGINKIDQSKLEKYRRLLSSNRIDP